MKSVKLFVMDVDGTINGRQNSHRTKRGIIQKFFCKGWHGINGILKKNGVVPVILTARKSAIVENRAKELDLAEIHQGCKDKKSKMLEIAQKYGVFPDQDGTLRRRSGLHRR